VPSLVPQKRRWINAEASSPYIETNKNNIESFLKIL
jgi:hypothetical protein